MKRAQLKRECWEESQVSDPQSFSFLFHIFLFKMFFVSLGAMWQIQTNNRGERASLNWLEERSSEREYAQSAAKFTEQRIRQKIESFHYFFFFI